MVAEDSKEVKGKGDSKTVKDVDEKELHGTGVGKPARRVLEKRVGLGMDVGGQTHALYTNKTYS